MRENCAGYRDEWELVFRDQTPHTIKRHKKTREEGEEDSIAPPQNHNSYQQLTAGLSLSHDDIGVNYFLHNFVIGHHPSSRGYLNYISTANAGDGYHPTLMASMAAVGLVTLANITRHPEMAKHARAKYSEAINQVNIGLASPTESLKDSTLMSVISLGLFEHISDFASWVRHVQGAAALIAARGKNQFCTSAAFLMFNQVRADMVAVCIHGDQPFPEELHELQEEATKHVDPTSVFWSLGVVATRCTDLFKLVKMKRGDATRWPGLLEQASTLQVELQHIFDILSTKSPYASYPARSGSDLEVFYRGRFDLYSNIWAIRIWNGVRILQIKICDSIRYIINHLLATREVEAASLKPQLELKLKDTLELLSKLGGDVIASVPQALGSVSPASDEMSSPIYDGSSPISGVAGYMMTWSLYTAGKSSVMEREARRWIIRRLQDFGRILGITLALHLVQDLIKMDEYQAAKQGSLILISGPFKE
jgi:hypothetical protein